jgi:hypothetical protein
MMIRINKMTYILSITALLLFNACTSAEIPESDGGFYYNEIYFGQNLSPSTQKGISDGCQTAKGKYTKLHSKFNQNNEYNNGWFLGRKRCSHLLKIDDKGDLLL